MVVWKRKYCKGASEYTAKVSNEMNEIQASRRERSGLHRADEKSGNMCVDGWGKQVTGEKRQSLRASGDRLEDVSKGA